jgi:hypothetical protein
MEQLINNWKHKTGKINPKGIPKTILKYKRKEVWEDLWNSGFYSVAHKTATSNPAGWCDDNNRSEIPVWKSCQYKDSNVTAK